MARVCKPLMGPPFARFGHCFGVLDEVDYRGISLRSIRFDEVALTRAVATRSRAQNALEQYRLHASRGTWAAGSQRVEPPVEAAERDAVLHLSAPPQRGGII